MPADPVAMQPQGPARRILSERLRRSRQAARLRRLLLALGSACCLAGGLAAADAADAAEPAGRRIALGLTAPLTGPLAGYAADLERGLRLGLAQVNAGGGVNGRPLELLALDDAGDPRRAIANVQELADGGVVAITGLHGTASVEAVLPLLEQLGVPVVGIASGAETLRDPPRRNVFNLRAGVREEAAAMVLHLDTIGITEIGAIAQDDAMGSAALTGIQLELARLAIRPQALVTMKSEGGAAEAARAVAAACKDKPKALVLALDARNALPTIRAARSAGCSAQLYVTSEAGAQIAGPELAGVVVSQVLPHPVTGTLPVATEFRRRWSAASGEARPSYAAMEGFVYAQVLAEALRRCSDPGNRRCLAGALEAKPLEAGGWRVQFAPADRRGSRFVEMTIVTQDGRFRR